MSEVPRRRVLSGFEAEDYPFAGSSWIKNYIDDIRTGSCSPWISGRVDDEEMIPTACGLSQSVDANRFQMMNFYRIRVLLLS
ncbi:hypothetical protein TNCV_1529821 [Trichonephila clavipes]|uniref:Uncharacterized protein n=1 Tax=Trichonephila clavipes TaxID=2585209 RepID=A0A8X6SIF6_TRICX|nr:hypothetical protein TNCV_1529821 [Trichonephila clavipes]